MSVDLQASVEALEVCQKGVILVEGCPGGGGDLQIDCFADTVYIPYR